MSKKRFLNPSTRILFVGRLVGCAMFFGSLLLSSESSAQSPYSNFEWSDGRAHGAAYHQSQPAPVVSAASLGERQTQVKNRIAPNYCDQQSCCDCGWCARPSRGARLECGWLFRFDALFLHRQTPDSQLLIVNTDNSAQNLNADDFQLGVHTGCDLSLIRHLNENTGIELRYFGVQHWSASATATTTPGDLLQINSALPIFTLSGGAITADYRSGLHNAEISLVRQVSENVSLLGGFRYLELDERGLASLAHAAAPFDYRVDTRNRISGFQLGTNLNLWDQGGAFSLGATGKAGIYGNSAAQSSRIDTGLVTILSDGHGSNAAFVGELGVLAKCWLTKRLAVRAGYNMLWLTSLALASDQLAISDFTAGTGFTSRASLFYHGAFAGLEFNW